MSDRSRQTITTATLRVPTEAFWDWLADECGIDLDGLRLVKGTEPDGDTAVLFQVAADLTPLEVSDTGVHVSDTGIIERTPIVDRGPNSNYPGRTDA